MQRYAVVNQSRNLACGYTDILPQAINSAQTEKVVFPQDKIVVQDRQEITDTGDFRIIYP